MKTPARVAESQNPVNATPSMKHEDCTTTPPPLDLRYHYPGTTLSPDELYLIKWNRAEATLETDTCQTQDRFLCLLRVSTFFFFSVGDFRQAVSRRMRSLEDPISTCGYGGAPAEKKRSTTRGPSKRQWQWQAAAGRKEEIPLGLVFSLFFSPLLGNPPDHPCCPRGWSSFLNCLSSPPSRVFPQQYRPTWPRKSTSRTTM